jgi:subtilisin family serine protease
VRTSLFRGPALLAFLILLLPLGPRVGSALAQAVTTNAALRVASDFRDDRILVQPKAGRNLLALADLHRKHGATVAHTFASMGNLQIVRLPNGARVSDLIARYLESGMVEFAEPDYLVHASAVPNDPRYEDGTLWGLHNTGQSGGLAHADLAALEGWSIMNSSPDIIVAVIDSGVRFTHEDLAGNIWVNPGEIPGNGIDDDQNGYVDDVHGINSINNTGNPSDIDGHGTHVAGILGAVGNNGKGVVGVAWKVQIIACKFLDSTGQGALSDAIKCIDYARINGAKVINASWGGPSSSLSLQNAIIRARDAGIIFVTAAGNEARNDDLGGEYPTNYKIDNIISVAATTRTDTLASYSNYGLNTVHLAAPGSGIYSTWASSDTAYSYLSGTSMSAPYVSGVFALMQARFPNETYRQIISRVLAATDSLPSLTGKCVTGGRLNLRKAFETDLIPDFTASPMVGSPPLAVKFTNNSVGAIQDRVWDFGDGTFTSSAENPAHTFSAEGTFTVSLTLTGTNGSTRAKNRVITVVANYDIAATNYDWITPANAVQLQLSDNGVSAAQSLSFRFRFYGQAYEQLYVGANGLIGFNNQGLSTTNFTDLPSSAVPGAILCPYWDNLDPNRGGTISIGTTGVEPNRQCIVSWIDVPRNSSSSVLLTFQAVLFEGSNQILFQYQQVQPQNSRGAGRNATVGIENETGLVAARYAYRGSPALLSNNQALLFIPRSLGGMAVTPTADLALSGSRGGPFSPSFQSYTVENTSASPLFWIALNQQPWLNLSPSDGVLAPGQRTNVVASAAPTANALGVGAYLDTISFINPVNGLGDTTRAVRLAVNGTNGVLTVSPDRGFSFNGVVGGPFQPVNQLFTLINTGDSTLQWSARHEQNWLDLSATNGILAAGESSTITISINPSANDLAGGTYSETLAFANLSNGLGDDVRDILLNVRPPQPAVLALAYSASDGRVQLQLHGDIGKSFILQVSSDLANWLPIFTNTISADGVFQFTDSPASPSPQRYYRALLTNDNP